MERTGKTSSSAAGTPRQGRASRLEDLLLPVYCEQPCDLRSALRKLSTTPLEYILSCRAVQLGRELHSFFKKLLDTTRQLRKMTPGSDSNVDRAALLRRAVRTARSASCLSASFKSVRLPLGGVTNARRRIVRVHQRSRCALSDGCGMWACNLRIIMPTFAANHETCCVQYRLRLNRNSSTQQVKAESPLSKRWPPDDSLGGDD